MAEYQRHPLARPHDVGQDFWAAGYAGPSLWDRQKYIDPRTGKVWESLEEALRFLSEQAMPDIRARDVDLPPGPPGEAAFRISQEVPTILPREGGVPPVATALPDAPIDMRTGIQNWRVNQEHELRKALEREETEPELQSIDTSMLSRLIPSAQASDLAPLPPPPTREELVDRGVALQELLKLEEAPSGPTPLRQPQIGPTQLEQPQIEPSLLEPPSIPVSLEVTEGDDGWSVYSRGEKVSGPFYSEDEAKDISAALDDMLKESGDASISKYKEFGKLLKYQESRRAEGLLGSEKPDSKPTKESSGLLGKLMDFVISVVPEAGAADTPPVTVKNYTPDKFLENWEQYYWAGEDENTPAKTQGWLSRAKTRMKGGTSFPKGETSPGVTRESVIKRAINAAVKVFGGDYGKDKSKRYSASRLRKDLTNAGWVESNYSTVKNSQGGSDSGYWQVQPSTAYDLLRSAKAHFVIKNGTSKFEQEFGDYDELLKLSRIELRKRMRDEDDQRLAAAFAALKILTTFDQE